MRFRVSVGIDEDDVDMLAAAARDVVAMGAMDAEQASVMLVEAVGLEVLVDEAD